jgi:DNA-binding MarR family transcriptional regulator
MPILADDHAHTRFTKLPATVSHSDYLQPTDVMVWSYIDCLKVDYKGLDGIGMKWPIIKVGELVKALHVKKVTVHQAISRLRDAGFLATESTGTGNRMILSKEAAQYDELKGLDVTGWTYVPLELITSGIPAQNLMALVYLDRKKGGSSHAWASHAAIAEFLGKDIRTVRRIITKVKDQGLLESSPIPGKQIHKYAVNLRDYMTPEERLRKSSLRLYFKWLLSVLSKDEIKSGWYQEQENKDLAREIHYAFWEAIELIGEESTADVMNDTLEIYGPRCAPDLIIKVLDEHLTDLGFMDDDDTDK